MCLRYALYMYYKLIPDMLDFHELDHILHRGAEITFRMGGGHDTDNDASVQ